MWWNIYLRERVYSLGNDRSVVQPNSIWFHSSYGGFQFRLLSSKIVLLKLVTVPMIYVCPQCFLFTTLFLMQRKEVNTNTMINAILTHGMHYMVCIRVPVWKYLMWRNCFEFLISIRTDVHACHFPIHNTYVCVCMCVCVHYIRVYIFACWEFSNAGEVTMFLLFFIHGVHAGKVKMMLYLRTYGTLPVTDALHIRTCMTPFSEQFNWTGKMFSLHGEHKNIKYIDKGVGTKGNIYIGNKNNNSINNVRGQGGNEHEKRKKERTKEKGDDRDKW